MNRRALLTHAAAALIAVPVFSQEDKDAEAEKKLLEVGKVAPDFTLPLVGGGEVTLSNVLKFGKGALVGFWGTDEAAGGPDLEKLQKLHNELESKGLNTILINPADEARDIKDFLKENKIDLLQMAIDGKETNRAVTGVWKARKLPTYYLVDTSAKVLYRSIGLKEAPLREALEKAGIK
jgi:peroxiredoxin